MVLPIFTGNVTSSPTPLEGPVASGNATEPSIGNQSLKLKKYFFLKNLKILTIGVLKLFPK
jgi:hypothetical protein